MSEQFCVPGLEGALGRARCQKKANKRRWYEANRSKVIAQSKRWQAGNREKVRASQLRRNYGLSEAEFRRRLEAQGGRCCICQCELGKGIYRHVDHDHKSGRVRGILCRMCNLGLGKFRDSPAILLRAFGYLELYEMDEYAAGRLP